MFALVLMNTSCEKPTDDTPLPNEITADKLVGNYDFQSLTDNSLNSPYDLPLSQTDIDYLNSTYYNYGIIDIGVRAKSEPNKYEISIHYKTVAYSDFTVDGNILYIPFYNSPGNPFNFEILSFSGGILKLKRGNATYLLKKV